MPGRTLILFGKLPQPGKVKTRLAVDTGDEHAAQIYRRLLFTALDLLTEDTHRGILYLDADPELDFPGEFSRFPTRLQSGDSLGSKMEAAFANHLGNQERVVLVGSDCPELTLPIVQLAFDCLDNADLVLGPATDGGYYLIGMKQLLPVFTGIPWSSDMVLRESLRLAIHAGYRVFLLPELRDLDTLDDLNYFSELFRD